VDAVAAANDAPVQMIDTSIVRVDQHGVCITRNRVQSMWLPQLVVLITIIAACLTLHPTPFAARRLAYDMVRS
jgi:hypothetical protein